MLNNSSYNCSNTTRVEPFSTNRTNYKPLFTTEEKNNIIFKDKLGRSSIPINNTLNIFLKSDSDSDSDSNSDLASESTTDSDLDIDIFMLQFDHIDSA